MSVFGLVLVLTAAVCHAVWNFQLKRIVAGPELVWLFSTISLVLYFPVAVYVMWDAPMLSAEAWGYIGLSAVIHLAYFLLLQLGYRKADLSLVYPIARATGPMLSMSFAVLFLGETITPQLALGGAVVIFGVLMLSGGLKPRPGVERAPALAFGIGAGVLIGSYTAVDAHAVAILLVSPLLVEYASSVLQTVALAPVAWKRQHAVVDIWRKHKLAVLTIALFNPLAYILVLFAMQFTPVVYVAPMRELSVVLTVLLGSILLNEGHLKHRLFWAAVIVAGGVVLGLAG